MASKGTLYLSATGVNTPELDINQIMELLPHRYPFLLIDRILEIKDRTVIGLKCVTINEPFFQGHFPGRPVMPGVLQIEAMAQTGAVLVRTEEENRGKLFMLAGVDDARFRRPVVPGDVLRIEVTEIYRRKSLGRTQGRIYVDGEIASEAVITYSMVNRPETAG
jgi:beta-hydroxyacyl-ACP dehydratase FabZ